MSDWKGAALVLQQLAEFRKPSQLDVLEKQYELQALANKTEREYNNKVKTYDALKAQYDGLVNEKKTLINKFIKCFKNSTDNMSFLFFLIISISWSVKTISPDPSSFWFIFIIISPNIFFYPCSVLYFYLQHQRNVKMFEIDDLLRIPLSNVQPHIRDIRLRLLFLNIKDFHP